MSQQPNWILHLDVDAFFAAVEQRDNERLRGRPIAVGTGVVASCSYEARPFGVHTGMRLIDARRLCRQLIVVPGDYRRYEIASRQILGICHESTPCVELAALDDLYLNLGRTTQVSAEETARKIAAQVRSEVGLGVSIGVGTNRLVSAVATQAVKEAKAHGRGEQDVAVVLLGREREYLAPWPVEVLPGVGSKTLAELERLNVRRVGELAQVPAAVLVGLFGPRGKTMLEMARGVDERDVRPVRAAQSVSRCTSFDPAVSEMPFIEAMLEHLLERATLWLRLKDLAARGLRVCVRYGDHASSDSRVSLSAPSNDEGELRVVARERLRKAYTRRLPIRLLGVELSPLGSPERQGELFANDARQRAKRLLECKDAIRERFGFLALTSGTALELSALERDRDNYRLRTPCLTR